MKTRNLGRKTKQVKFSNQKRYPVFNTSSTPQKQTVKFNFSIPVWKIILVIVFFICWAMLVL